MIRDYLKADFPATSEDAFPLRVRIPRGTCRLESDSDALVDAVNAALEDFLHIWHWPMLRLFESSVNLLIKKGGQVVDVPYSPGR
jgi:hypothetical protein